MKISYGSYIEWDHKKLGTYRGDSIYKKEEGRVLLLYLLPFIDSNAQIKSSP